METQTPKYRVLAGWIKERIQNGEILPGERFYSENELGEMFGISRQTVRQAITLLQAEGYVQGRRGSGTYVTYRPEVAPARTMTIGVISTYVDDYIFPPIIRGIGKTLSKNGYSMQLVFTLNKVENETRALKSMLERGVDGVIAEPTKSGLPSPNIELYRQLAERQIPVIFFNAYYPGLALPHVALDDKAAGKVATQRLIRAGHRKIAAIFQSDDLQGHLRYAGYLEALMENGIDMNANRVLWFATEDLASLFVDEARILRRMEGASAVICYNDQVALRLLAVLAKNDLEVPRDLSVVSVDNSVLAEHSTPPLTSVNHPKEVLGKAVAENLLRRIESPAYDASVEFEAKLVERDSVRQLGAEP